MQVCTPVSEWYVRCFVVLSLSELAYCLARLSLANLRDPLLTRSHHLLHHHSLSCLHRPPIHAIVRLLFLAGGTAGVAALFLVFSTHLYTISPEVQVSCCLRGHSLSLPS